MWQKILILISVLAILAAFMVYRYKQLRIEFDNTRFFNNAAVALSLTARGELNPQGGNPQESNPVTNDIKTMDGNLLPHLHARYPETLKKALIDPFLPEGLQDRYIHLQYGYAEHTGWRPPAVRTSNNPVWFVWSAGPSRMAPEIIQSVTGENQRLFRFDIPLFQPSNGLSSQGYLFADTMGNRVGKIR